MCCPVHCGKTADRIRMPFGMVGRTGPGMRQVVEFGDRSTGRGNFVGKYGAPHCNQWGLLLLGIPSAQLKSCCLVNSWHCGRVGRARRAGLTRGVGVASSAATRPSCHVTAGRLVTGLFFAVCRIPEDRRPTHSTPLTSTQRNATISSRRRHRCELSIMPYVSGGSR